YAALLIPLERVEPQPARLDEATEDAGEQDAVVGAVRLVAEHADTEAVRVAGEQFLDDAAAGHAGADDDHGRASCLDHGETPRDGIVARHVRTVHRKHAPKARTMPVSPGRAVFVASP